jgi:hypothetical protein
LSCNSNFFYERSWASFLIPELRSSSKASSTVSRERQSSAHPGRVRLECRRGICITQDLNGAAGMPSSNVPVERTPLPWPEISVALVVLTTEAISFQYLFPFVPFMVRGFGIREEDVGFYAGWIASSFMVGQFFSSFFWGRMSDVVGLKPVMLIGMTFTCLTVALFGVSKSLEWAMATRFIGGASLFPCSPCCPSHSMLSISRACPPCNLTGNVILILTRTLTRTHAVPLHRPFQRRHWCDKDLSGTHHGRDQ